MIDSLYAFAPAFLPAMVGSLGNLLALAGFRTEPDLRIFALPTMPETITNFFVYIDMTQSRIIYMNYMK